MTITPMTTTSNLPNGVHTGTRFRVLVTGSRTWSDQTAIRQALGELLAEHGDCLVVVHGACRYGADAIAEAWATVHQVHVERHAANWRRYGRFAGLVRNTLMVATGPDLCLAFIRNRSVGASHCASTAVSAGITTRYCRAAMPV